MSTAKRDSCCIFWSSIMLPSQNMTHENPLFLKDTLLKIKITVIDQRGDLIVLSQLKQMEHETISKFVRWFKLVNDRCSTAWLEENTIIGFFLEALQERVLQEVFIQHLMISSQMMDFSLISKKLYKKLNKVRYEEVSMPQYLMISTKVIYSL